MLFYIAGLVAFFACLRMSCTKYNNPNKHPTPKISNVLFIFAHPDDEAMFMTPTLHYLVASGAHIHWLCLTDGSGNGHGETRAMELLRSASHFGVPQNNVEIITDPTLPDSMTAQWPIATVEGYVQRAVKRWGPTDIFTFDSFGVSGHINHQAVHRGVAAYNAKLKEKTIRIWTLHSHYKLRKYSGMLLQGVKVGGSRRDEEFVIVPSIMDAGKPLEAMKQHASQLVWFRYLFVWISSYTYENIWTRL
eukprot:PhF_6_TR44373/c0_g1_i1/m.68384/K03434/PIGL; N-acetylglucosaminylphosphatidylinositol deacetylase